MFKRILDNTDKKSLANKFRTKRFKHFAELINSLPNPVSILDVGGTENFWQQMGLAGDPDYKLTILNITESLLSEKDNMKFIKQDASDLGIFSDKSFDIVFSNSVIEHIPLKANRQKMASEIARVGKRYFVQTPNYYFPFEPHFLFPCFQFFPHRLKIFMLRHFNMGWFTKCEDTNQAKLLLEQNQLLKYSEFLSYFPNSNIIAEKFLLLNKSFIAVKEV